MSTPRRIATVLLCLPPGIAAADAPPAPASVPNPAQDYGIGTPATAAQMQAWDITVGPRSSNLPDGSGTPAAGKEVYEEQCSACHGAAGEGGIGPRLVGGIGSLAGNAPVKAVGSYWPYATTLFDLIRRAMPFPAPQSLSSGQVYSVSAYILESNGIIPDGAVMDRQSLPAVKMPNRDGFVSVQDGIDAAGK